MKQMKRKWMNTIMNNNINNTYYFDLNYTYLKRLNLLPVESVWNAKYLDFDNFIVLLIRLYIFFTPFVIISVVLFQL